MIALCRIPATEAGRTRRSIDRDDLDVAAEIVEDVRTRGEVAVREHAERLGDRSAGDAIVIDTHELRRALEALPLEDRALLERTATRIRDFAEAQLACVRPLDVAVAGGRAGHRWLPVESCGAYAPGGRYPLPSSVLMTVIPARVAGVSRITLASPRPTPITLAAAAVAGADAVIAVGGAQAIAALAFGTFGSPADVIVGPGNRFVTAAKRHLVGEVGIDAIAGPSELLILADEHADPATVAADLIGQAEHDVDAVATLVTPSLALVDAVDAALVAALESLPTAPTARQALLRNGAAIVVRDLDEGVSIANRIAPEHLELICEEPRSWASRLTAYGSLFVGERSAEVFGDYGAGPNHVLPTAGSARFCAGLSVMTFLRPLTYLEVDDAAPLVDDAARFARWEGLEGHARSALRRADRLSDLRS